MLLGLVALVAVAGLVAVLVLNNGSNDDETASTTSTAPTASTASTATTATTSPTTTSGVVSTTTTAAPVTFTGSAQVLRPLRSLAPPEAADDVDGCGDPTSYGPEQMVDQDETTGWRMSGDGEGQRVKVNFAEPVRITRVGIVNGLAEPDDCTGTADRYSAQRRFVSVRWVFDDGSDAIQRLDTDDPNLQTLDVDAISKRVVAVIGRTDAGTTLDFTAIAEIEVTGVLPDSP